MRRKLAVGAAVEDLRSRCPYFYDVAAELHRMIIDDGLAKFVANTFTLRYRVRTSILCPVRHPLGDRKALPCSRQLERLHH